LAAFTVKELVGGLLREEVAYQAAFFFVFDASEQLRAERLDCRCLIEGHFLVDLAAAEVTRLTLGFKNGFDLRWEINSLGGFSSASRSI
jgi:hypothetical protein